MRNTHAESALDGMPRFRRKAFLARGTGQQKTLVFGCAILLATPLVRLAINSLLLLPLSRAEKAKAKKKKLLTQEIDRNLGVFGR